MCQMSKCVRGGWFGWLGGEEVTRRVRFGIFPLPQTFSIHKQHWGIQKQHQGIHDQHNGINEQLNKHRQYIKRQPRNIQKQNEGTHKLIYQYYLET